MKHYLIIPLTLIIFITQVCMKKITYISDVHLDILYDSNTSDSKLLSCRNGKDYLNYFLKEFDYGRFNCNPSEVLFKSALSDMHNKLSNPDLVIIGGDMISHGLYD